MRIFKYCLLAGSLIATCLFLPGVASTCRRQEAPVTQWIDCDVPVVDHTVGFCIPPGWKAESRRSAFTDPNRPGGIYEVSDGSGNAIILAYTSVSTNDMELAGAAIHDGYCLSVGPLQRISISDSVNRSGLRLRQVICRLSDGRALNYIVLVSRDGQCCLSWIGFEPSMSVFDRLLMSMADSFAFRGSPPDTTGPREGPSRSLSRNSADE